MRREKITKMLVFDALFFLGDDVISGFAAKMLQGKKALEGNIWKGGPFGLPRAVPLNKVFEAVGDETKAYRLSKRSFWSGILGTALLLGVTMPLLNFWYTNQKVTREQGKQRLKALMERMTGRLTSTTPARVRGLGGYAIATDGIG